MKTVCKFALVERHETAHMPNYRRLIFEPRYDNNIPEDARFLKATPSGRFEILTDNRFEILTDNQSLIEAPLGTQFESVWTPIASAPQPA